MSRQGRAAQGRKGGALDFSVRLMEHLVVPTFVLDADCRVIIWNRACERLTGIAAAEVLGTREHWRGFYEEPRPCLADLIAQDRTGEIAKLYAEHDGHGEDPVLALGRRAENWCVMPRAGTRLYLAIDAGPIYDDAGELIAVVETLRDITAQKIAQDELQRLATRDGLTGVANRRSFDTALSTECRRVTREARSLSLLMIDVDFFKRYNDTYGHLAGDECLRQVAEAMAHVTQRASDTLARYGGEEFAILLPATEPAGAVIVAERIRAAVETLALPHARSEVSPKVTVSIGVASLDPTRSSPPTELIAAADAALYAAKMQGRNRVVQAGAGEASPPR
ncbi:Phytochrome-like protein cph2 [Burkholderiales bacterium]|nr:Phytochrome-like protein cph2 [Burkholderiales bacterium]